MIMFDVVLEAQAEQREAFLSLLRVSMAGAQAEPGCLIYRFTADLDDPLRFYLIELWEDETAFKGHARGEPFRNFLTVLPTCGRVVSSTARSGPLEPYEWRRAK